MFFYTTRFFFRAFRKIFFPAKSCLRPWSQRYIILDIHGMHLEKKKNTEKKSLAIVFYCLFSVYIVYTVSQPSVEFRGITLCIYHFISYILYFHIKYLKLAAKKYSFNKIYEQITFSCRSHHMTVTSQVSALGALLKTTSCSWVDSRHVGSGAPAAAPCKQMYL